MSDPIAIWIIFSGLALAGLMFAALIAFVFASWLDWI